MNGKYFYKNEEQMPHNSFFSAVVEGFQKFSYGEMKGQNQMQALQIPLTKQKCKVLQRTREPSEWLCFIGPPPSEEFCFFAASPFGSTMLLILVTHSVLSLILSAFSITAL